MQQPDLFGTSPANKKSDAEAELYRQLIKLGDMIGDGLADEPDGKWIHAEYRKVMRALGHTMPRRNSAEAINKAVATFLAKTKCDCGGRLVQTRSGAKKARCTSCSTTYTLSHRKPKA
ncbi:hypothetical protein ACIPL1_27765 [Pseudomonas sp. NPDC090202]|uniref:hypothetical protein n=1 Tax=Pseudomonas sp. NPDC090202 TaxID=3364476 RepID=UPI0038223C38